MATPTPKKRFADPPGRTPTMKQELEQLRQRGLTKSLNKHFTQECKKVQAELAAAEAALTDLETRKANASSDEITQLDMMCMKVSEWKKQCRKNEQEIVLLYQRYVQKFAGSVELAMPEELMTATKDPEISTPMALVTTDIRTLVQAFQEAEGNVPDLLRPKEAYGSSAPAFNTKELEEILEDASLADPDAPCKSLAATPRTEVESDLDDSSIVSGLTTLNSAVTREVLHDVGNDVLAFIKNETENIRKMMEEDAISVAPSVVSQKSKSSVVQETEDMVKKMQQVLDAFKKAEEETTNQEKSTMVRRLEGYGNEGDEWIEHWDETFQRPFYVEGRTNKTQWHMPQAAADASVAGTSLSDSANSGCIATLAVTPTKAVPSFQEFIPQQGRRTKRVEAYRAKRRRQRKRQLVSLASVLCVLGAGALYYKHTNPDKMNKAFETLAEVIGRSSGAVVEDKSPRPKPRKEREIPTSSTPTGSLPVSTKTEESDGRMENPQQEVNPEARAEEAEAKKNVEELKIKVPEEPMGIAISKPKTQHWILDVLIGPLAFKDVNRECSDSERYCGIYHY